MMSYVYVLIAVSLALFIGSYFYAKSLTVDKSESECKDQSKWTKDKCYIWDNGTCYKATSDGTNCVKKGSWVVWLMLTFGVLSLGGAGYCYYECSKKADM